MLVGISTSPETALASEPDEIIDGAGAGSASASVFAEGAGFELPLFTTSTSCAGAVGAGLLVSETEMLVTAFLALVAGTPVGVAEALRGNGVAVTTAL